MVKNIQLFSLQTFSSTGGIQKMTRTLAHSLYKIAEKNTWNFKLVSVYDTQTDLISQYLPESNFKGYQNNKIKFLIESFFSSTKQDVVILSHINLALLGVLIKIINPRCKVWLIAHGIEIWGSLSYIKKKFLTKCDKILCVSNFTMQKVISEHNIDAKVCTVLNNVVDSFIQIPQKFDKPNYLQDRYNIQGNHPIIFTLSRLSSLELYKGHDNVIRVLKNLKNKFPQIKYVLAGKYDEIEKVRIDELIEENGVENQVILTGFINETELIDHFLLADLFVLPSKGEGFGIVFIEALACGLPVICGNEDGSIDAICNGELGTAIGPDNLSELEIAISKSLVSNLTENDRQSLQRKCLAKFNEDNYMVALENAIN
jgi:glycosyltransferase involved in cell wall biosynthesis